jgi:hypothetical protein
MSWRQSRSTFDAVFIGWQSKSHVLDFARRDTRDRHLRPVSGAGSCFLRHEYGRGQKLARDSGQVSVRLQIQSKPDQPHTVEQMGD